MAKAVIAYDKDLPEIPGRCPWEKPIRVTALNLGRLNMRYCLTGLLLSFSEADQSNIRPRVIDTDRISIDYVDVSWVDRFGMAAECENR